MGASLMLTRLLKSMLFEIQPRDPATLTAVAVAVLFAAIAAALFPARRAAAIEPVVTLRHE
jgi:ABC-type lipoprotein release transport system permease subunit